MEISDGTMELLSQGPNRRQEVLNQADAALARISGFPVVVRPVVTVGRPTVKHSQSCGCCKASGLEKPLQVTSSPRLTLNLAGT